MLEKSLGAIAKGGTSELVDVIQNAEPIKTKGLGLWILPDMILFLSHNKLHQEQM